MADLNLSKLLGDEEEANVKLIINNLLMISRSIKAAADDVNIITRRLRELVTQVK